MKTITKKKVKIVPYTASIKVLGKTYSATGLTAREAIGNLKVGNVAKGMSVLTLSKGEKSCSKVLPPIQTFRLFTPSRLIREVSIKNVAMRFPEL